MAATSYARNPEALTELIAEAKKLQDGGEEGMLDALFGDMDDEELIRSIYVLHDMLRAFAQIAKRDGGRLNPDGVSEVLNIEVSAMLVAFMRFAPEPFAAVMSEHIPWALENDEEASDDA